ncbi:type II methionyl aminopeptidase [Candidatus Woesearchaeota archaeon CG_4_10_14_0_2_um_filter_33_10]|nr:MAG: type II methionyl aminopeptidase [Candidatus Woesearchaeota archaeon CG1_02_33_12]PIN77537.1 MAG: type II methionyl aminopeptidase [Candidatus Woesearchaeota archaeon CG10_big_fil_rev_8_21_14_0_10_33_12]PIU72347.1 MAG: type II methionyl aminopeptidase [Candidatus Woesearchaeota archaeon CG06_land_8_20_14_3_00_33_13]PIZ53163.1 MAG: type II methionyl aminopeptidase [Candidatus Woesearchaeota archaeon CG_4_10_14_0_2_um_filter_33_10]
MNISDLNKEGLENWKKSCNISAQALEYGKGLIKKGNNLLDVARKTDEKIISLGGEIAFPSQISMNQIAAHFCPTKNNNPVFENQIVKLDVGAHVNGFIGDNACTVDLSGENSELVKASRDALNNAIKITKPGITLAEIGRVIQETIMNYGFAPVRNLSGHGLGKFDIHTKPTIPNYDNGDETKIKKGDIFAIEPFATNGHGIVIETSNPTVFSLVQKKPVRDMTTRQILKEIENYKGLPFAKWWLEEKFSLFRVNLALRQLENLGIIKGYPPLADRDNGLVSQAEHTILVDEKTIILTKS